MKKPILIIFILVLILAALYYFSPKNNIEDTPLLKEEISNDDYVTYQSTDNNLNFTYPEIWGGVLINEGNKICPEEDSYRTPDTLRIYDKEFSFKEIKLPGSESMIRMGVKTYKLDSKNLNNCGDEFHSMIALKQLDPNTLSSFRLNSIKTSNGLEGTFNPQASRLDTEGRIQYTFYIKENSDIYIWQTYLSFIPYFDSPELKELDDHFPGDMVKYIEQGKTSREIREYLEKFRKMSESLTTLKGN